jgi:hypothetical protein
MEMDSFNGDNADNRGQQFHLLLLEASIVGLASQRLYRIINDHDQCIIAIQGIQ